jgi:hypothetical protein
VRKLELIDEYYPGRPDRICFHVMANVFTYKLLYVRVDLNEIIENYNYFIEDSYFSGICKHIDWNYPQKIDWIKASGLAFFNHDISGIDFWFSVRNTIYTFPPLEVYMNKYVSQTEIEKFQRQKKKLENMIEKASGYVIMDQ